MDSSSQGSAEQNGVPGAIQSVARVCAILDLLSERQDLQPVVVAERLGLERTTAHRYLSSLLRCGYLKRDSDGRHFAGPALMHLAVSTLGSASPVTAAGPYMRRLVEDTQQTVVMSMWGGDGPVVCRVEEDDSRLVHVSVRVGSALPYDAAQSQAFLAFLPNRDEVDRLLRRLPARARRDLETQLEHARAEGYAVNSVVVEGIRAIAAPVFGRDGAVEATLAVVGTVNSIPVQRDTSVVKALLHAAEELSRHLGHQSTQEEAPRDTPEPTVV